MLAEMLTAENASITFQAAVKFVECWWPMLLVMAAGVVWEDLRENKQRAQDEDR